MSSFLDLQGVAGVGAEAADGFEEEVMQPGMGSTGDRSPPTWSRRDLTSEEVEGPLEGHRKVVSRPARCRPSRDQHSWLVSNIA